MLLTIILEIVAGAVLLQAIGTLNSDLLDPLSRDSVELLINETYLDCCFEPPLQVTPRLPTEPLCWTLAHANTMDFDRDCGDDETFRSDFVRWLRNNITPMAAVALSFMALELLLIFGTCASVCTLGLPREFHPRPRTRLPRVVTVDVSRWWPLLHTS